MTKHARIVGIALLGVAALLIPMNASATCATDISFGSYYSFIQGTSNGPGLRANFWALNGGNPTIGAGADNGSIQETGVWLVTYPAGSQTFAVLSGWGQQQYDGCIDAVTTPPNQRMVMSFSDVDALGNPTFAVTCTSRDTAAGTQFDFTRPSSAPIALVPAVKPVITNTTRNAVTGDATITIGVPDFAAGFYTNGSAGCDAATVIPQFDVYKQQLPRGGAVQPGNDGGTGTTWGAPIATCSTSGSPACTVTTTCGTTNCDNVFAVVPHFNSNFTTADAASASPIRVSTASTKVQAGPTLAVTPKPRTIPNPKLSAPGQKDQQ
jgi:hypothetical protein